MYRFLIDDVANAYLSTAQLAARTGLPPATVRMWETRHGFPAPARLPGGHRRYSDRDVEAVAEVLRLRRQGMSLSAAIEIAQNRSLPQPDSVFAGLRRRRPDVAPTVMRKRVVLALTHALEDEYFAHAARGVMIGSFQHERNFRGAEQRWREIARTSSLAVALADFAQLRDLPERTVEVPIEARHPLAREWTLIISAPDAQACVAAWEQPTQEHLADEDRRFEVLWSFEPAVVSAATDVATEILRRLAPAVAERLSRAAVGQAAGTSPELRFAATLAHRIIDYVVTVPPEPA